MAMLGEVGAIKKRPLQQRERGSLRLIAYKVDVLAALKDKGFTTYRIRKDKLFSESTLQAFRTGDTVSWSVIDKLCVLLGCDVGDVLHHVPDGE